MSGGSPKFNTPEGPPKCPECEKPIRYQERCRMGGVWKHQRCSFEGTYQYLVASARELELKEGTEQWMHGLAVLSCMQHSPDFKKAADFAGLTEEFVVKAMQPLIDQGILKDGIWHYDSDVDLDDPQQCSVQILMWILCSEGKIVRRLSEENPCQDPTP